MLKKVLLPIAHGTEELEAIAIIDICRRAGLLVNIGKVKPMHWYCEEESPMLCTMSRGVVIQADDFIEKFESTKYDCICLPGGM